MSLLTDRRRFIQSAAGGLITLATGKVRAADDRVTVSVVRNERAVSDRNVCDRMEARAMIDRGLADITGASDPAEAWRALGVIPSDIVGIKVNCNTWTFLLHTHPELVYALCDSLSSVVKPNNIIIYERNTSELSRSGYEVNTGSSGVRAFGNDEGGGYSPEELTNIVAERCTKIINMPSLKTVEQEFGGSLFLKNHIGSIPNSLMTRCHGNALYCTEVCARPDIMDKTILGVCDGLRGTYKRGTPWYFKGIIMSADQVAAEQVALTVINSKRTEEKLKPVQLMRYVMLADSRFGLGTTDWSRIDVKKSIL